MSKNLVKLWLKYISRESHQNVPVLLGGFSLSFFFTLKFKVLSFIFQCHAWLSYKEKIKS